MPEKEGFQRISRAPFSFSDEKIEDPEAVLVRGLTELRHELGAEP